MTGLEDETYSNSLGMNLTKIEAGEFYLGFEGNTLPDALVGRKHTAKTETLMNTQPTKLKSVNLSISASVR